MQTANINRTPKQTRRSGPAVPELRDATPADVVELASLKRRVERSCYSHLGTPEALAIRLHRRCTAWYLLGRIAAGDLMLLAEQEGQFVGLGVARFDQAEAGPALHLHSTYVEASGQGVGSALTASRLQIGAARGLSTVTADCFVGADRARHRLELLGLREHRPQTASPTFPGARLSHWVGNLHTALERVTG